MKIRLVETNRMYWHSYLLGAVFEVQKPPSTSYLSAKDTHYVLSNTHHNQQLLQPRHLNTLIKGGLYIAKSRTEPLTYQNNEEACYLLSKEDLS